MFDRNILFIRHSLLNTLPLRNQACLSVNPIWVRHMPRGISLRIAPISDRIAFPLTLLSLIVSFELHLLETMSPKYFSCSEHFIISLWTLWSGQIFLEDLFQILIFPHFETFNLSLFCSMNAFTDAFNALDVLPHLTAVMTSSTISSGGTLTVPLNLYRTCSSCKINCQSLSIVEVHISPDHTVPCMTIFLVLNRSVIPLEVLTATFASSFDF